MDQRQMGKDLLKPPAGTSIGPEKLLVEGMRILNPKRITWIYACGNESLKAALLDAHRELPWTNVASPDPCDLEKGRKIHDGDFVLLLDYLSLAVFDATEFRKNNPGARVILISDDWALGRFSPSECMAHYPLAGKADTVFYFDPEAGPGSMIVKAAVRCAEDHLNINESKEKRFVFLAVDSEPRWHSQFLPVLYRIIGQRADVALARTYEEASELLGAHGDKIICLITDLNIQKAGSMGPFGKDFIALAKKEFPRFPVIVASESPEAESLRDTALIISKPDSGSLDTLERYVQDFTGLGDFLFYDGHKLVARASNLIELLNKIGTMEARILEEYAQRDYFSTWLYMHGYVKLADFMRPRQDRGETLRNTLVTSIYRELANVADETFEFRDGKGHLVATAENPVHLAKCIAKLDMDVVEPYSHVDALSTWLMRKGYVKLADDLRPLHGYGESLRRDLLEIFATNGFKP